MVFSQVLGQVYRPGCLAVMAVCCLGSDEVVGASSACHVLPRSHIPRVPHATPTQRCLMSRPSAAKLSQAAVGIKRTAIHEATLKNAADTLSGLLNSRWREVNAVDHCGRTPVHEAARSGYEACLRHLLCMHPHQVNTPEVGTAVHEAARYNQLLCLGLLLERGFSANAQMADGSTPMHAAAQAGFPEAIAMLANERGTIADIKDKRGETSLHRAVRAGHARSVACLYQVPGFDVDARNNDGKTAQDLAVEQWEAAPADCKEQWRAMVGIFSSGALV